MERQTEGFLGTINNNNSHNKNENKVTMLTSSKEYFERGMAKVLDTSSSSSQGAWLVGTTEVDHGVLDLKTALELAGCEPPSSASSTTTTTTTTLDEEGQEEVVLPPTAEECAEMFHMLGRAYQKSKQWDDSLTTFQKALEQLERTVGRYDHRTAEVYHRMATVYETMKDSKYNKALKMYEVAYRIELYIYGQVGPWNTKKNIRSLMVEKMGGTEEDVTVTLNAIKESLQSEKSGDRSARKNKDFRDYKFAIEEEEKLGIAWNANLVLLHRKLAGGVSDNFMPCPTDVYFEFCNEINKGDELYFSGDYSGAISVYDSLYLSAYNDVSSKSCSQPSTTITNNDDNNYSNNYDEMEMDAGYPFHLPIYTTLVLAWLAGYFLRVFFFKTSFVPKYMHYKKNKLYQDDEGAKEQIDTKPKEDLDGATSKARSCDIRKIRMDLLDCLGKTFSKQHDEGNYKDCDSTFRKQVISKPIEEEAMGDVSRSLEIDIPDINNREGGDTEKTDSFYSKDSPPVVSKPMVYNESTLPLKYDAMQIHRNDTTTTTTTTTPGVAAAPHSFSVASGDDLIVSNGQPEDALFNSAKIHEVINKELVHSCCENLGAIMAQKEDSLLVVDNDDDDDNESAPLDWSFQPKSDDDFDYSNISNEEGNL